MALTPLWYKLIFNRGSSLQKRTDEINQKLAAVEDPVQRRALLPTTNQWIFAPIGGLLVGILPWPIKANNTSKTIA